MLCAYQEMKDALLLNGDYNVLLVGWGNGSARPYLQAVANCVIVGAEIAKLIVALQVHLLFLLNYKCDLSEILTRENVVFSNLQFIHKKFKCLFITSLLLVDYSILYNWIAPFLVLQLSVLFTYMYHGLYRSS